jgi:hypothetical protein
MYEIRAVYENEVGAVLTAVAMRYLHGRDYLGGWAQGQTIRVTTSASRWAQMRPNWWGERGMQDPLEVRDEILVKNGGGWAQGQTNSYKKRFQGLKNGGGSLQWVFDPTVARSKVATGRPNGHKVQKCSLRNTKSRHWRGARS